MLWRTLGQLIAIGFIVLWFLLLIDCVRRKEFYPVFGKGWGTKLFWLATFAFINPFLTLLYLIFGWLARPSAQPSLRRSACVVVPALAVIALLSLPLGRPGGKPITLKRDLQTGQIVADGRHALGVEANAAIIATNSAMNSSNVSFSSDHTRVACRRILILNQSRHPLMERVGAELQQRLAQLPFVDEVVYLPAGKRPAEGGLAPDVTILLDSPRIKVTALPFCRWIAASVQVAAGPTPYASNSHYSDGATPPAFEFQWNGDLSHRSRMIGYETAAAKYTLAANNIAGDIAKSLSKQINDWSEKYGLLPPLPDSFYGAYRPTPRLPFLPADSVACVLSTRGLMCHNRTVWRFEDNRDTTVALGSIKRQLESEGWKDHGSETGGKSLSQLRMTRGVERLVAFRQQRTIGEIMATGADKPHPKTPLVAHYENVFSEEETEKALGGLLESGAPSDTLLLFERFFARSSLRDRFFETIEKRPARSPEGHLMLAETYQSRGDNDKARRALLRAAAWLRTRQEHGNLDGRIKNLAKKLGDEKLAERDIPNEVLRDAGFIEITSAPATLEREVALDEPVVFYYRPAGGDTETICGRVQRPTAPNDKSPYVLHYLQVVGGSRSWGSIGGQVDSTGHWSASTGFSLRRGPRATLSARSAANDRFGIQLQLAQ